MGQTSIEWTNFSINPIRAKGKGTDKVGHFCEKISAGCKNCYASNFQKRFGMYEFKAENRSKIELFLDESKLEDVISRRVPTKYFWCDMTDMFYKDVPFEWIDKIIATMTLTPQHTHQILTKRPERMLEYFSQPDVLDDIQEAGHELIGKFWYSIHGQKELPKPWYYDKYTDDNGLKDGWYVYEDDLPIPNIWLGTSVEDQENARERIPILAKIPAAVRFLSVEPMLGEIHLLHKLLHVNDNGLWMIRKEKMDLMKEGYPKLGLVMPRQPFDWVIVGGESGRGKRPFNPDWARIIRDECKEAGVAFFMKQIDKIQPIPEDLMIREFP